MIYTNAIIDGFPVILGSFPIQFGMFLAMVIAVRIPKDPNDEWNPHCKFIYTWVIIAHICNIICQAIKHYLSEDWHVVKKVTTIFCLFIQLVMINTILGDWVYDITLTSEEKTDSNWLQFHIWIILEFCVFLSYIASSMCYIFIRAFKVN